MLAEYGVARVYLVSFHLTSSTRWLSRCRRRCWPRSARAASPAAVLIPATATGKEIAGRLAVRLDSGLLTDVVGLSSVDGDVVGEQAVFGGTTTVHAQVIRGTPVLAVRPNSVAAAPAASPGNAERVDLQVALLPADGAVRIVEPRPGLGPG